jgi:hypothetical protein
MQQDESQKQYLKWWNQTQSTTYCVKVLEKAKTRQAEIIQPFVLARVGSTNLLQMNTK